MLPGGPYAAFGGKDASRGLATFSVTASEVEYDDLSDLTPPEMDSVREWEMQFKGFDLDWCFETKKLTKFLLCLSEKYELVGKLLKVSDNSKGRFCWFANRISFQPGEQPTNYSDEDDEPTGSSDKSGGEQEKSGGDQEKSHKSEE